MIYILSENNKQAEYLASILGFQRKNWLFVRDADRLRGLHDGLILRWASYWRHPDYVNIMHVIEYSHLTLLDINDDEMRQRQMRSPK